MSPSRMIRSSVSILFLMLGAVLSSPPQVQQSAAQPANEIKTEEAKFYADAHPYQDEPLPQLKKMVHELEGLKPAPSPEPLSDLLAKVGAKADELLQKVPDLISDEAVTQTQWTEAQGLAAGCTGTGCLTAGSNSRRDEKFSYIILTHPAQDRRLLLEEYRTTEKGKAVPQGTLAPHFQGFVSAWVVFSSLNQVESRFRYLGRQKTHGHNTFVVGFAQIPGSIEYPGRFQTDKGSIPMLFQGIAWIDQSDFRIVRLRIDLLAPQPEIALQSQTAHILFGPVHIARLDSELWLPQAVEAEMGASGQFLREEHQYSKYRLYRAKSRIVLNDPRTPQYFSPDYKTAPGTGVLIIRVLTADTRDRLDRQALLNLVSRGAQTSISQATDDTSKAVFANLPYGSYDVEVSAVGYLSARQELAPVNSPHPVELDVVLQRDPSAVGLDVTDPAMPSRVRKDTKHAISALKSGNLKQAQEKLDEAYKLVPSNPSLNFLLGYLYFEKKDFLRAGNYLATATTLNPHNGQALALLGRVDLERQDLTAARSALEQAVAADPENWLSHSLLADAYLRQHDYGKAREEAQLAIDKGKSEAGGAHLVLGEALVGLGRSQEAIQALQAFLQASPRNPVALQVSNLIADLERRESSPAPAENPPGVTAFPPRVDPLLALPDPGLSLKARQPPGIDDVKPSVAAGVACPVEEVIEGAGERVEQFVDDVSRFAAVEELVHQRLDELGSPMGTEKRRFNYVASISETTPGFLAVDESREDISKISGDPDQIASTGFAALALVFHPHMRDDFEMKCEGLGDWHGQATWLVHFRQRDGRPSRIHGYTVGERVYPVNLKGRAWIRADTFQIVRIESEMVSPMPQIRLLSEHQVVEYAPIQFQKKEELWLPKSAEIYFDFRERRYFRRHSYDHYMLFSVESDEKRQEPKVAAGDTSVPAPEPPKTAGLLPVISSAPPNAAGQLPVAPEPSNDKTPAAGAPNETPFQLKATSNLVIVRVVVRDAQGKPVENLGKENFRLFDRGKAQTITQFEVETAGSSPSSAAAVRAPGQAPPLPAPPAAPRFMALYFDDLNTSDADLIEARDAADRYLATNLQANDRVAIVTSEEVLSDFTSDTKQIHEALLKLHGSARALSKTHYCPDLSDYQALQITQNNAEAFQVASDEAAHCEGGVLLSPGGSPGSGSSGSGNSSPGALSPDASGSGGGIAAVVIRTLAQNIVAQTDIQARFNLQRLEQVVKYLSRMPGQRTMILVSPGFMSQNEQFQLDRLIDHALQAQVVISSLDPKGLAVLMRQADTSRSYIPATAPAVFEAARRLDSTRELVAVGVLADVAQGSGGEFFHNSNDLPGGFGALAGSPVYYILAFAPADKKDDGKFHALKVTLVEKEKGFRVQARRGYFASKNEAGGAVGPLAPPSPPAIKETQAKQEVAAPDPEVQEEEQIQQAVLSRIDVQQLPVALEVKLPAGPGDTRDLSLFAHLDANSLHFRREGEHNLNTVNFIFAVFDQKEDLVNAQQRLAKLNVLDAQLPNLLKAGVDVSATFQLKPGSYRIREVVTDSEDHHMTALSRNVHIQ